MADKFKFDREKLLKYLNNDPYKEAALVCKVPLKMTTLQRIKTGSYIPSELLGHAIMLVIEEEK